MVNGKDIKNQDAYRITYDIALDNLRHFYGYVHMDMGMSHNTAVSYVSDIQNILLNIAYSTEDAQKYTQEDIQSAKGDASLNHTQDKHPQDKYDITERYMPLSIDSIIDYIINLDLSQNSKARYCCSVRAFLDMLRSKGYNIDDFTLSFKSYSIPKFVDMDSVIEVAQDMSCYTSSITSDDNNSGFNGLAINQTGQDHDENIRENIKDNLQNKQIIKIRNGCIIGFLCGTGMRVSEFINIKISDILDDAFLVHGKGNAERLVPKTKTAIKYLNIWMGIRNHFNKNITQNSPYIFINNRGSRFSRQRIFQIIKSSLGNISPHDLRHAFATCLINQSIDTRVLQLVLGHVDISSTQIYTYIGNKDMANHVLQYHPMSSMSNKNK